MPATPVVSRRGLILLLLLSALVWFANLDYRKLVKPDEGRYAEISREMAHTGDWVTPRLNAIKYFEKPPMQYWATAAAYKLFGENEWTARLWTGLSGFLGLLLVWHAGRRLFGAEAGVYAALVAGSSLLYVALGHINTLDMGVTFFMTASLTGFLLAQRESASAQERRNWMLVTWAAMAGAMLSKGLIGVILPGAALVLYSLIQRDLALWRRLHIGAGMALFLLITVPWFVLVSRANPEFLHFFFIHEHFERFTTTEHRRQGPLYYFVPLLLVGIMPWIGMLYESLVRAWKGAGRAAPAFNPQRMLLIWSVFIFTFFSISGSKLPAYILPIFPSLALLVGWQLAELSSTQLIRRLIPVGLIAAAGFSLGTLAVKFAPDANYRAMYVNYSYWLIAASAVMLLATGYAWTRLKANGKPAALIAFAFGGLIANQFLVAGHESLARSNSSYYMAQEIKPYFQSGTPFYCVKTYDQTLPFYLARTCTLVEFADEMHFGVQQEPQLWLPRLEQFEAEWRRAPAAIALMQPDTYTLLAGKNLPMRLLARDSRRVIIQKP